MKKFLTWLGRLVGFFKKKEQVFTFASKDVPAPSGPVYEEVRGSKDPFGDWFALVCIKDRLRINEDLLWKMHETQIRSKLRESVATANLWAIKALQETESTADRPIPKVFEDGFTSDWVQKSGGSFSAVKEPHFHELGKPYKKKP